MTMRLLAAVAAVLVSTAGPAAADSSEALLAEVRAAYEATTDLTARFVQDSYLAAAGMDRRSEGTVVFKKGGKMRWTYEGDDPQVIVSDGDTLWIYQVRDKTVLRQDLASLPPSSRLALDLLSGFQGVEAAFRVGSCGPRCLELTPVEERPDLSRVLLELDEAGPTVREVTTEDALGNRTRVRFQDVRRNTGVADDVFAFTAPEGVQVLDMQAGR